MSNDTQTQLIVDGCPWPAEWGQPLYRYMSLMNGPDHWGAMLYYRLVRKTPCGRRVQVCFVQHEPDDDGFSKHWATSKHTKWIPDGRPFEFVSVSKEDALRWFAARMVVRERQIADQAKQAKTELAYALQYTGMTSEEVEDMIEGRFTPREPEMGYYGL
jgi:hypothetical protein